VFLDNSERILLPAWSKLLRRLALDPMTREEVLAHCEENCISPKSGKNLVELNQILRDYCILSGGKYSLGCFHSDGVFMSPDGQRVFDYMAVEEEIRNTGGYNGKL
jgi:hypothetical protein